VSITLPPATAQDQDSQFVRCTLVLAVPPHVGSHPSWALQPPISAFLGAFWVLLVCFVF